MERRRASYTIPYMAKLVSSFRSTETLSGVTVYQLDLPPNPESTTSRSPPKSGQDPIQHQGRAHRLRAPSRVRLSTC